MWSTGQLIGVAHSSAAIVAIVAISLIARTSAADHDAMVMSSAPGASAFTAGVSMIAADFSTPYYIGDYQGVAPAIGWMSGMWSASAMMGLYRLEENGRTLYGPGDLMWSASATVVDAGPWRAGATLGGNLPIGDQPTGFGMGHVMVMPSTWAVRRLGALSLRVAVGYARALTDLGDHDHGAWPLVEPMNMQELEWSAAATLPVSRHLAVAARGVGAVAIAVPMGVDRAVGAFRVTWADAKMTTALELQVGITGDPFTLRGVIETGVGF